MTFASIPERNYKKTQWLSLKEGVPCLIQILEDEAHHFLVHTVKSSDGMYVKIPHDEGSALMNEPWFQEKYSAGHLYRVNVMDVTPYVTTSTGASFSALQGLPERDPRTGENLRELPRESLNEVKLLERGVSLFRQINSVVESMMIENPETSITDMVFFLQRNGTGLATTYTFYPRPDVKVQDTEDVELFDTDLRAFTDEEISKLLKGVSFKDVLSSSSEPEVADNELDFSAGLPGLS